MAECPPRRSALALLFAALVGLLGPRCDMVSPHLAVVAAGLDMPVLVTAPRDDPRLFVLEQPGRVRVIRPDGSLSPMPFLDLRGQVATAADQGLLGLAFSPDYARDGELYVYYTATNDDSVVSRFVVSADPDRADPASEHELVRISQPASSHNGGTIAFSPADGMLYTAFGDGGGANAHFDKAQDPASPLGKMLRLDVGAHDPLPKNPRRAARVPPDNPFVSDPTARDEIWASGLHNPYRWSFDRETGDLWIADEGRQRREEVDFQPAGDPGGHNYGWPVQEGSLCHLPDPARGLACENAGRPNVFTFPMHEYNHGQGCSIVGGHVYRGGVSWLTGSYLFGDHCRRRIWMMDPGSGRVGEVTRLFRAPGGLSGLLSFGEGGYGDLYLTDRNRVYRFVTRADSDGDEVLDRLDNCPGVRNGDQADTDRNGVGDACETRRPMPL